MNQMKRKYTIKNVLLDKDTFSMLVQPGVDYSFIVILGEIHKEGTSED